MTREEKLPDRKKDTSHKRLPHQHNINVTHKCHYTYQLKTEVAVPHNFGVYIDSGKSVL